MKNFEHVGVPTVMRYHEMWNNEWTTNVVVTCSSLYKYALAKYAEIPACRSFMISDIPNEREDFFRNFIGEIHEDYSDGQILDLINCWIQDGDKREEMTNIGYEYTHNNYT